MHFKKPEFIVPGIFPEGSGIISARPKAGKTILSTDIAAAVATGGECLGQTCTMGAVLYLALEDNLRRMQRRMRKLFEHLEGDWPENLSFLMRSPRADFAPLEAWARTAQNPRLLIVDTLGRFRPPSKGKNNGYQQDYDDVSDIHNFAADAGVSLLLVHHNRKSAGEESIESISGTFGISGAVDTIMVMARDLKSGCIMLHGEGRDIEPYDHALTFDKDAVRWKLMGGGAEALVMSATRKKVLAAFANVIQPAGPKALADASGLSEGDVKQQLIALKADGRVLQQGRGEYRLADESYDDPERS